MSGSSDSFSWVGTVESARWYFRCYLAARAYRAPRNVDDFQELLEALNNQGQEKGAERLTAYICEAVSQHKICGQARSSE